MNEITLPSGAILKIGLAPFVDSKELFQAITDELKNIKMEATKDVDTNFLKDLLCSGLSSKRIDAAVTKCFAKCLYNGIRIDNGTFEPDEARQDYLTVFYEVAVANVAPFTKSLSARLQPLMQIIQSIRQ